MAAVFFGFNIKFNNKRKKHKKNFKKKTVADGRIEFFKINEIN